MVWTRLLSLLLGGTVYTFSLILAVFLIGLGIGSSLGAGFSARIASPRLALGVCQWLLAAAIAWTALIISESLPYWPIVPAMSSSPWYTFQVDLVRCLWAVLPPACLWGASFPLALAAVAVRGQDPGRLVGGVYAANTIGAIAGAIVFSLLVVPALGTASAERVLIGLAASGAIVACLPLIRATSEGVRLAPQPRWRSRQHWPCPPSLRGGSHLCRGRSSRLAANRRAGTSRPRHRQGHPGQARQGRDLLQLCRRGDE